MTEVKQYIQDLLAQQQILITDNKIKLFEEFVKDETNCNAVQQILHHQKMLMSNWEIKNRVVDIQQQHVSIPNGTVGKAYEASLNFITLGWDDIVDYKLEGLTELGLIYNVASEIIKGLPAHSGDIKLILKFRIRQEPEDAEMHERTIALIINPDPKSLWKNIDSDATDPNWKEDTVSVFSKIGDKHIVVASSRGRSHANAGSFREDDFAFKYFEDTGWGIVAVSDGAGSAKLSRQGSKIACDAVITYFEENLTPALSSEFDSMLLSYKVDATEAAQKMVSHFTYNNLSKAAYAAYQKLVAKATEKETLLKDFHSTLIFTLFKKYDFGYAILSFGVGDCPIAVLNKNLTEVTLMNGLDVGEFGGGTRFITMPEIFKDDKFSARFKFKLIEDFSYLIMMTDGIYDPKFVVEANLEKIEKWQEFLQDMEGKNEDNAQVIFDATNKLIAQQLSAWMNFWSAGNHDDRTLAIVF